jgi:CubicO group peptidase (beta-lactamase class C family)/peptidoglycan/LPS O-acetylase OafA/YrhL
VPEQDHPPLTNRGPAAPRDRALDLVRAAALVRVVVWHATGAAVVTLVAAMPLMFFVSGSLFAASASRRGTRPAVWSRLRRLGPPLWLFGAFAWMVMAWGARASGTSLDLGRVWWWIVPLGDPAGSTWEGGWLATPLWYLRTLLWILLLAPLMARLVRRAPGVAAAAAAVALVALEYVQRVAPWRPAFAPQLPWQVGDVVLFGVFFAFGMWVRDRSAAVAPRTWATAAAIAAGASVGVWLVIPPPGGVVNDSHLVHLVVGSTLLFAVLAVAAPMGRLAERSWVRPAVDLLGRRSFTVYLWHTTAVVAALWLLERLGVRPQGLGAMTYAALVVVGTAALVAATGWVEDVAAGRRARLLPVDLRNAGTTGSVARPGAASGWRRRVVSAAVALAVLGGVAGAFVDRPGPSEAAFRPRVPSQAPPVPEVVDLAEDDGPAPWEYPATVDDLTLQMVLGDWAVEHDVPGASVAISVPGGGSWVGVTGVDDGGEWRDATTAIDAMSVTKLFTANLVYRAVDEGLIALDDPLPPLAALPDLPLAGRVTVRQLLSHRSGLVNYRDTETYRSDPSLVRDPFDAVAVSVAESGTEPGAALYSSTNYLILGYLLEQVTGRSFDELLADSLIGPIGLAQTAHLAPEPGEPRFATGGIIAGIEDLARAGEELLVNHVGISEEAWREMSAMDPEAGLGAGTMQFCPCSTRNGVPKVFAVGYAGGHTLVAHLPDYDVVVALDVTGDFYGDDGRFDAVEPLLRALADALRQAPLPVEDPTAEIVSA